MKNTSTGYRIGKVSKLTGITPDTLRIWERRYAAVTPTRSDKGGRLYGSDEITRLKLMKSLVDHGDSIGSIATLGSDELQHRLNETQGMSLPVTDNKPLQVIVVGESLYKRFQVDEVLDPLVQVSARYERNQQLKSEAKLRNCNILIIEQATLQQESIAQLIELLNLVNADHVLLVYRFAASSALDLLPDSKFTALRSPVETSELINHCLLLRGKQQLGTSESVPGNVLTHAPNRRYDDATLAKLASISTTINCECPQHLAELLSSLTAFERYSTECESRNSVDAELHTYLSKATSHARHLIEDALELVIEMENIEV